MLKENRRTLILTSIITVAPIMIGVLFWNRLPDVMATHFGFNNEANGFSSKIFAVFGIPVFCLAILWLGAFFTSADPRNQNISKKMFRLVLWIVPVVSIICAASIYSYNLGYRIDLSFIMCIFMGVMFVVVGNFLPKARQNYTIGIKIPWTLADENNWNRTHRFGGFLWVVCGFVTIILTLCGIPMDKWVIVVILVAVVLPVLYSLGLHLSSRSS